MNVNWLTRLQVAALLGVSALLLATAPQFWHYGPDSGIYVGTARTLAETGAYRFNGYPNLLYYPGFPSVLSLSILLFGLDFHVMHLLTAAIAVSCLWLTRACFPGSRYGVAGVLVPLVLACNKLFLQSATSILSDGLFLLLVLGSLLLWRSYQENETRTPLAGCLVVVMLAPLVRFEGVLLCAAFSAALGWRAYRRGGLSARSLALVGVLGAAAVLPFAAWTWRNVVQHTPETFNMANAFLFGLEGLELYAPGFGAVDWANAEWMYPFLRIFVFVVKLASSVVTVSFIRFVTEGVAFVAIIVSMAAGVKPWFSRATLMERFYLAAFSLFSVCSHFAAGASIYVVERYWFPVLPLILIVCALGLSAIHERLSRHRLSCVVPALAVAILGLALWTGYRTERLHIERQPFYRTAASVLDQVSEYAVANIPADARVATTDWGVMPFVLRRQSYQLLNDPDHLLSLERMARFGTEFLVIMEPPKGISTYAKKMVKTNPTLFELSVILRPREWVPVVWIYKVDLPEVRAHLARHREASDESTSSQAGTPPTAPRAR